MFIFKKNNSGRNVIGCEDIVKPPAVIWKHTNILWLMGKSFMLLSSLCSVIRSGLASYFTFSQSPHAIYNQMLAWTRASFRTCPQHNLCVNANSSINVSIFDPSCLYAVLTYLRPYIRSFIKMFNCKFKQLRLVTFEGEKFFSITIEYSKHDHAWCVLISQHKCWYCDK